MKEFIQQMYNSIQEGNVEQFDDIENDIKNGKIGLSLEDIIPLCNLIIFDSEYIEYSQIIEIARMTFWAIEKNNMEEGLRQLAIGLEEIYTAGQKDTWTNWYGSDCEEFIDRYISMAVLRYKEEDMYLFGKALSQSHSTDFKSVLLKVLRETVIREEDREGYHIKAKILEDSINL